MKWRTSCAIWGRGTNKQKMVKWQILFVFFQDGNSLDEEGVVVPLWAVIEDGNETEITVFREPITYTTCLCFLIVLASCIHNPYINMDASFAKDKLVFGIKNNNKKNAFWDFAPWVIYDVDMKCKVRDVGIFLCQFNWLCYYFGVYTALCKHPSKAHMGEGVMNFAILFYLDSRHNFLVNDLFIWSWILEQFVKSVLMSSINESSIAIVTFNNDYWDITLQVHVMN